MGVLDQAIAELRSWHHCPACGRPLRRPVCEACGLPLGGDGARLLREQSEAAAQALEARQRTLAQLMSPGVRTAAQVATRAAVPNPGDSRTPTAAAPPPTSGPPQRPRPAPPRPVPGLTAKPVAPRPEVNPVAVFSAVGVGALVAAALVLAFLVPADRDVVRIVLLGVTAASAGATLAMRRRRPVSAAAIATGTALLCLLVIALFVRGLPADTALPAAAGATAGLAAGLGAAGFRLRLRPWVSAGILLAPLAAALAAFHFLRRCDLWGTVLARVAGLALAAGGRWVARRWQGEGHGRLPFVAERILVGLGSALALALAVALLVALALAADEPAPFAALLALAVASAAWVHGAGADSGWRRVAGMVAVLAPLLWVLGLGGSFLLAASSASVGWLVMAALSALPPGRTGRWSGPLKGGWAAALLLALPAAGELFYGVDSGPGARLGDAGGVRVLMPGWTLPDAGYAVAGLLLMAAVCAVAVVLPASRFAPVTAAPGGPVRPDAPGGVPGGPGVPSESSVRSVSRWLWPWLTLTGLAALAALPVVPLAGSVGLLLGLALASGLVAWRVGDSAPAVQLAGRLGGGLVILAAAAASWDARPLTLAAGAGVVALVIGWTRLVPSPARPALVGAGYGYALILLGFALRWYPLGWDAWEWTPVAGLLAVAASLVSLGVLAATPVIDPAPAIRVPWPRPRSDAAGHLADGVPDAAPAARVRGLTGATAFTVLVIGLVPWFLAVWTVLDDRTWWAAGAAASMLAVESAITGRVRPQPTWLRVLAAASLLPTAGVLLINAGAMLIPGSGSPILLPIVAALAGVTAIAAPHGAVRIQAIDPRAAVPIRGAFEAGALLTAVASVVLAVVLPAAGPSTALVVCAILAAGAAVVATQPDRRPVWWLAALAASGVLWSALVLLEVGLVEAYTLPLGVAAVIVGLALARRNPRWWVLAVVGLQLGLWPTWVLTATGRDLLARAAALTAAAVVLAAIIWLGRRRGYRRPLWALAGGLVVAGTAPLLVAIRSSWRVPAVDPGLEAWLWSLGWNTLAGFAWVVGAAAVSAGLLAVAGQGVRWAFGDNRRWGPVAASWRFAPALAVAASGFVLGVRPNGVVVWAMWLACLAFLAVAVASTLLRVRGRAILPPVWYCWLLALGVGIAGWSVRALRVEFHALPLGLTLLACGVIAWRAAGRGPAPTEPHGVADRSWPIGRTDPTWAILPGVLATLGPSTLAIGTDPQTWRAILVLVMALVALLVGARLLWRPCMTAGIVDLSVAIVLVFIARRGAIDAVPWLIALVGAGGVLLGLAIYSERRQHAVQATPGPDAQAG